MVILHHGPYLAHQLTVSQHHYILHFEFPSPSLPFAWSLLQTAFTSVESFGMDLRGVKIA